MSDYKNVAVTGTFDEATGVATLNLDMEGSANKVNEDFGTGLRDAFEWAEGLDGLKGVILGSAKKNFCVGADIDVMFAERDVNKMLDGVRQLGQLFRGIETFKVPVVCALAGSALGGGYELALACHHRIALDSPKVKLGLPEVMLGVIPGGGGTQRLPRLIGLQPALERILAGKQERPAKALKVGMVDQLANTPEELREKALAWIADNKKAKQPWDKKGFEWPGGVQPGTLQATQIFMGASAMLYKKTAGAIKNVEVALQVVEDGAKLAFDGALEVEARAFSKLAVSDQAKDMLRTIWFHRTAAEKGEGLPRQPHGFKKVGILGAGMMGAGLGWICAKNGMEVVLKDISADALDAARKHCEEQTKKALKFKTDEERAALMGRIRFTLEQPDLTGCDLIIEAVIEDNDIKAKVTEATEPLLADNYVFASNTSAIPINLLAKASAKPEQFIGLHYFSPVEKMPLLEIICGDQTSEETLARCVDFGLATGKLPIVVGDGYGFYTSRTFSKYLMEASQLVAEGHDPVLIEWAAREAGMVVAPLKVFDEVTLRLGVKGIQTREKITGETIDAPGLRLIKKMVELGRIGKVAGKGFYDYEGKKRKIWQGLSDLVDARPDNTGLDYITKRLMLTQVVEVARCLEEGILKSHRDAEVGAVFGIGFAPSAGGPLAWMDRYGIANVVEDLDWLADETGNKEHWAVPQLLRDMAAEGKTFFDA